MRRRHDERAGEVMPNPPTDERTGRGDFGKPKPNVGTTPDLVLPFLASGGAAFFITREDLGTGVIYNPASLGAQLITTVYVPPGRVGWLKQIRVGPYKPAILHDVWDAGGIRGPYTTPGPAPDVNVSDVAWQNYTGGDGTEAQVIYSGVWESPFGWETYRIPESPFAADVTAEWHWQLSLMQGNIDDLRRSKNIPQFNFVDPTSWYLAPNFPVPFGANGFNAYPGGIPGSPVGVQFGPQRMQATPKDPLNLHLMVPENTTLCLFATWRQTPTFLRYQGITSTAGAIFDGMQSGVEVNVLGPSYGSLLGYTQPITSAAAVENGLRGWGG